MNRNCPILRGAFERPMDRNDVGVSKRANDLILDIGLCTNMKLPCIHMLLINLRRKCVNDETRSKVDPRVKPFSEINNQDAGRLDRPSGVGSAGVASRPRVPVGHRPDSLSSSIR